MNICSCGLTSYFRLINDKKTQVFVCVMLTDVVCHGVNAFLSVFFLHFFPCPLKVLHFVPIKTSVCMIEITLPLVS